MSTIKYNRYSAEDYVGISPGQARPIGNAGDSAPESQVAEPKKCNGVKIPVGDSLFALVDPADLHAAALAKFGEFARLNFLPVAKHLADTSAILPYETPVALQWGSLLPVQEVSNL